MIVQSLRVGTIPKDLSYHLLGRAVILSLPLSHKLSLLRGESHSTKRGETLAVFLESYVQILCCPKHVLPEAWAAGKKSVCHYILIFVLPSLIIVLIIHCYCCDLPLELVSVSLERFLLLCAEGVSVRNSLLSWLEQLIFPCSLCGTFVFSWMLRDPFVHRLSPPRRKRCSRFSRLNCLFP